MLKEHFNEILEALCEACTDYYGERLISVAVFGSVARGTMRPDSDIDVLLVIDSLPAGRMARVREFAQVEAVLAPGLKAAAHQGVYTTISPIFKTPEELRQGSLLFLDMTDQARILVDRNHFLRRYLEDLAARLAAIGARRVYRGGGYYWLLKPDLKPREKIYL